jgi:hypothetical protein
LNWQLTYSPPEPIAPDLASRRLVGDLEGSMQLLFFSL